MACKTSYDLHHNFPRLAEETGFAFNTHRPRVHIDWNKIRLIDIESLAKDRKFVIIEQHVNDILDCVLESEFDVRILDEGVVKLFRLAQLAVEYQQFCRHYLDRSVFVLRQEIDTLAQELGATKKEVQEKEEELRRLRRKGKHNCRPLLSYGNDNIATMILKSLTNKGELFPSPASAEVPQYNKCNYCEKAFLNQLYLKSHISRRHVNTLDEFPERNRKEKEQNVVSYNVPENNILNDEINELKLKLKEMENLISANNKIKNDSVVKSNQPVVTKVLMKDVENASNNVDVFDKLEEWKRNEQENHAKEINLLRNQIFETLNSFREKEDKKSDEGELKVIDHLHVTIREQGAEILALKQALTQCKLKTDKEEKELKKKYEEQILTWAKRDEAQSKKYDLLIMKLNKVGKESRESRAVAEAERQRAGKLEAMLEERLNNEKRGMNMSNSSTDADAVSSSTEEIKDRNKMSNAKTHNKSKPAVDDNTLQKLHRKAQELLNIKSSTSSEISSAENVNNQLKHSFTKKSPGHNIVKPRRTRNDSSRLDEGPYFIPSKKVNKSANRSKPFNKPNVAKVPSNKKKETKTELLQVSTNAGITLGNGPILPPGSPLKVVRAKITEEVNSRLVAAGVDPLKSKLHRSVYQKQKMLLQQQLELKSKKYPAYEQVRYTIMAYLDSDASGAKKDVDFESDNTAANVFNKPFSLSSMISNVKSKALSFVKSKDIKRNSEHKELNSKQTSDLLKTPPGSPVNSNSRRSSPKSKSEREVDLNSKQNERTKTIHTDKIMNTRLIKNESSPYLAGEIDADSNTSFNSSNITIPQRPSRSIDNLIMSPVRRPASANAEHKKNNDWYALRSGNNDPPSRTQSATNVSNLITYRGDDNDDLIKTATATENDDVEGLLNVDKLTEAEDSVQNGLKHTKGVLKNASSTLSLYKKKVIFDMDAIQMKSVSASPSQSLTEKSDDKDDLDLNNIGNDEWDISSIENEPINTETKIHVRSGATSKVAELKQTIEAQLARRSETPSTVLVGGVDLMRGPAAKAANIGGSNTSLGSSILDNSDSNKVANRKTLIKPRKITEKDDSELDISDFSIDGVTNKNDRDSF